jgi:hypothetical protein
MDEEGELIENLFVNDGVVEEDDDFILGLFSDET